MVDRPPRSNKKFPEINAYPQLPTTYQILEPYVDFAADLEADRVRAEVMHSDTKRSQTADSPVKKSSVISAKSKTKEQKPSTRSPRQVKTAPTVGRVKSGSGVDVRDSLQAMTPQPQANVIYSAPSTTLDPKSAFEKAVESLAAMKLHDYALKRKERMRNRYKLWDEIRGTQREMEITGAEQALLEFQEMLAAWKIKYYIQKYKDKKSYESLDDEKKNWIRQCKGLKKKVISLQGEIAEYLGKDLEGVSLALTSEKSVLEVTLEEARATNLRLNGHIEKLNETIESMKYEQEQVLKKHAEELESAARVLEESRTETKVVREEMDVSRRACQDYLRTITALENKLQDAQEDLSGLRSGDMKDSIRLQTRIDDMERDMQELVAKLDMTIEVKNTLVTELEGVKKQLKTTSEDLRVTQEGKKAIEVSNEDLESDLEAKTSQIGSLERLVTEISVQRDNLKELLSEGVTATVVYKADMAKLQAIINEKTTQVNELTSSLATRSQELAAAIRSDDATIQLLERTAMNVEDLEMKVLLLEESNAENYSYARVLETQVLQARRQEHSRGGVRTAGTPGAMQGGGSAPASTFNATRMQSPGAMASFYTSASAGNTMHMQPSSPGYYEDFGVMEDSMLTGSITSNPGIINPLENRLVSLLSLLEDKLSQLDGVVKNSDDNVLLEEEDSRVSQEDSRVTEENSRTSHEDSRASMTEDSRASMTEDSRASMTEDSRASVTEDESMLSLIEWEDHVANLEDQCAQIEEELLDEKTRLENTKADLSDARDEIQTIQREKEELKNAIKKYQRKYQQKYGRMPPDEGADAESMALYEHFQQVQADMQTRLTEAQSIATEALNFKMECDRLQDELAAAQDELEMARMELEQRQVKKEAKRKPLKPVKVVKKKKPAAAVAKKQKKDMTVVEEADDEDSYATANGGSRSTVGGGSRSTVEGSTHTPAPPSRPKSNKHYSELDKGQKDTPPRPGRKVSEPVKPVKDERGAQVMSFHDGDQSRSGSYEDSRDSLPSLPAQSDSLPGQNSSVESRSRGGRGDSSDEAGPTDSYAEYESAREGPGESDIDRNGGSVESIDRHESSVDSVDRGDGEEDEQEQEQEQDDNVSAYSSLQGASIDEGEGSVEERGSREQAGGDELVSLTGSESPGQVLQVVRRRLQYHKQVLGELADEKENCRDAIEKWTLYFLKEQGRVPGLADSKYGTNNQVFENFNGAQHDIYAHHTEVQELFDIFDSKRDEIAEEEDLIDALEDLEEDFQDPLLSLPEGEEYEDAYKLHFESVETLLANGPPDNEDMSITSTNTALTGFYPNGVLDFANLADVAKLDVLENIETDIKQFNQDIAELHTSLHEARNNAEQLNSKLNELKAELKAWHKDYVSRHGREPSDQVKEREVSDLYLQCHDLHTDLEEEMEKMRTIALISTAKATEVDRLKVLKRRFARRAPSSYAGSNNDSVSQASLSSSLSNMQSHSREITDKSESYMGKDDASMSLQSDASSRSLKFAKENLQKDIAKMSDDLDMLQAYVTTADEDVKELRNRKDECKEAAKQWEEDFIRTNKRKPTVAEKKVQVEDLYDEYSNLQEEIAEVLEQRDKAVKMIAKIEQSMEHKVNKLGIISEHEGS
jgi:DNA repair exonuclease SbcCD ATPase subunit